MGTTEVDEAAIAASISTLAFWSKVAAVGAAAAPKSLLITWDIEILVEVAI